MSGHALVAQASGPPPDTDFIVGRSDGGTLSLEVDGAAYACTVSGAGSGVVIPSATLVFGAQATAGTNPLQGTIKSICSLRGSETARCYP